MLPDLEYVIVHLSPHKFGAVQAGLAFQVFQLLELLLSELDLCNLLCHSAPLSDSVSAGWIMDSNIGRLIRANAMTWSWSQDTSLCFTGRPVDGGSLRSNFACQNRI